MTWLPETRSVLMVGASGRVGRMVQKSWNQTAPELRLVPQFRNGKVEDCLIWNPMDGHRALLEEVDRNGAFATMIVLAGVTPATGQPFSLNVDIAEACLDAANSAGIGRVLLASSSAVYGVNDGLPLTEQTPCNPVNEYGQAKLEMERAAAPWRSGGMDLCCLRIGNVAGADALLLNVAASSPGQAITIDIFDDGRGPVRSYIGPRSFASVLATLCGQPAPLPGVLNIAAPVPVSMDALATAAGHPWSPRRPGVNAQQDITLDCSALSRLHEFSPEDSTPDEMVRQWKDSRLP